MACLLLLYIVLSEKLDAFFSLKYLHWIWFSTNVHSTSNRNMQKLCLFYILVFTLTLFCDREPLKLFLSYEYWVVNEVLIYFYIYIHHSYTRSHRNEIELNLKFLLQYTCCTGTVLCVLKVISVYSLFFLQSCTQVVCVCTRFCDRVSTVYLYAMLWYNTMWGY